MRKQRPTLEEFRRDIGKYADGKSDEELQQLQDQVEWFARFAVEQTLAARVNKGKLPAPPESGNQS